MSSVRLEVGQSVMVFKREQVDQQMVEREAELCLEDGVPLHEITGYSIGKRLDRNANITIYKYLKIWKARKQAEAAGPLFRVSAEHEQALASLADKHKAEFMVQAIAIIADASRTNEAAANLKVAQKDQELRDEKAANEEILELWENDTTALTEALEEIATLRGANADLNGQVKHLEGRLQQVIADRAAASVPSNSDNGDGDDFRPF